MKFLAKTLELLQGSSDSLFAPLGAQEIGAALQFIQAEFEQTGRLDTAQLRLLFAPTGPIQDIAIDNGWGAEFLLLAAEVDKITGKCTE